MVVAIAGPPKPYLLIDLAIRTDEDQQPLVVRVLSQDLDPCRLIGRNDLAPREAFKEIINHIAAGADVVVCPATAAQGQWPRYENIDAYQQAVLNPIL